jgi:dihydroorotate dehydrogenase (NAD+) catalytic subunit
MAVDWRRRKPILGNTTGGLSGPAIKPLALRAVWRIAKLRAIPVIGVGGIATLDDAMEFLLVGASAVQIGTANFYDPTASLRIVDGLADAVGYLGCDSVRAAIGMLEER